MLGLLRKDCYLTVKYARMLLVVSLIMLAVGLLVPDNEFCLIYPALMIGMLPSTLYAYDEREKWTTYIQALPVSRRQYVTEKYLFGLLASLAYLALFFAAWLIAGRSGAGEAAAIMIPILLLAPALLLPVLLRFGVEKGRIAYFCIAALVAVAAVLLTRGEGLPTLSNRPLPIWGVCLASLALLALSWLLSVTLFERREL